MRSGTQIRPLGNHRTVADLDLAIAIEMDFISYVAIVSDFQPPRIRNLH
jgi:hypothetical protein